MGRPRACPPEYPSPDSERAYFPQWQGRNGWNGDDSPYAVSRHPRVRSECPGVRRARRSPQPVQRRERISCMEVDSSSRMWIYSLAAGTFQDRRLCQNILPPPKKTPLPAFRGGTSRFWGFRGGKRTTVHHSCQLRSSWNLLSRTPISVKGQTDGEAAHGFQLALRQGGDSSRQWTRLPSFPRTCAFPRGWILEAPSPGRRT